MLIQNILLTNYTFDGQPLPCTHQDDLIEINLNCPNRTDSNFREKLFICENGHYLRDIMFNTLYSKIKSNNESFYINTSSLH